MGVESYFGSSAIYFRHEKTGDYSTKVSDLINAIPICNEVCRHLPIWLLAGISSNTHLYCAISISGRLQHYRYAVFLGKGCANR